MGRPITDDLNGKMLDADNDRIYSVEVTVPHTNNKGETKYLHAKFDIGHDSFLTLFKPISKEKFNWVYWSAFDEEEAKKKKRKGEWLKFTGTM